MATGNLHVTFQFPFQQTRMYIGQLCKI
jgi:hypothetical protein